MSDDSRSDPCACFLSLSRPEKIQASSFSDRFRILRVGNLDPIIRYSANLGCPYTKNWYIIRKIGWYIRNVRSSEKLWFLSDFRRYFSHMAGVRYMVYWRYVR